MKRFLQLRELVIFAGIKSNNNVMTNNLNTFKILYIIKGVLAVMASFIFLIYASMGSLIGKAVERDMHFRNEMPFNPADLFVLIGTIGLIMFLTMAILAFVAAKKLNDGRGSGLITVAAIVNCFSGILGIVLCIFTLIELAKPNVKAIFNGTPQEDQQTYTSGNNQEII